MEINWTHKKAMRSSTVFFLSIELIPGTISAVFLILEIIIFVDYGAANKMGVCVSHKQLVD